MNEILLLAAPTSFWLDPSSYWAIAQVLLGLGAVIFVHELGHFLVAKACGVKCEKFYVGFDAFDIKIGDRVIVPRSLVKTQWGETEYGIGILPLGGYVKMLGQDDNPGNIEKEIERSKMKDGADESDTTSDDIAQQETGLVDRDEIDPRSYLAKSVPQRMAIISAGVIFNLLFAILFAALAFRSGVDYEPPMIGTVVGGGPGWKHNLSGADIKHIGERKVEDYFTFLDMAEQIVFNTDESSMKLEYVPYGESETKSIQVTPQKGLRRENPDIALLGIADRVSPRVGEAGAIEGTPAGQADPPIQPGDRFVKIGEREIETGIDLRQAFARYSDQAVTVVLERETGKGDSKKTEQITTTIDRNPMRRVGFDVQWLPIAAVQIDSPADKAGLKEGDEIVSIHGETPVLLETLEQQMIQIAQEQGSVEIEFIRDGENRTVSLQPVVPKIFSSVGPNLPVAIDTLGIAVPTSAAIAVVEPETPASESNIQVGDEILSVTYRLSEQQQQNFMYAHLAKRPTVNLADDKTTWAEIFQNLQMLEPGTEIKLELKRGTKTVEAQLKTVASDEYFLPTRGVALTKFQKHYQSENWSDAFKYGSWQVWKDIKRVGTTLAKLIKGKISPTNLGGPGTIAMVATSEATRGTSRLLLFLTFLSANLAIVNFLPIPILDGGHMLFLAYEGIFRRPVSEKAQVLLTYAGLAMILGLMLFVVFLDIGRISSLF